MRIMPALSEPATLVREADEADLDSVVSVLYAANSQFASVLPKAFYRAYMGNVLDVRSRLRDSRLLVAEHEGRVAGTITLYPDASREGWGWPARWAGIRAVAVIPSARGHGIGRRLTQECIRLARADGAQAVCLHTAAFMEAAVGMYEGLGFRRRPEYDRVADAMFAANASGNPIMALAYCLDL
jgi:ribosomal protein S18 acetylase RimI-like enzyme